MMKFNFTKQIITAAMVASVSFFGCQKSEMDEVDTLMASSEELIIEGACGTTLENISMGRNLKDGIDPIGAVEIGNTNTHLIIQFTSDQPIRTAAATINGVVHSLVNAIDGTSAYDFDDNVNLAQIVVPKPEGASAIITALSLRVGGCETCTGNSSTTVSNRIDGNEVETYSETYEFQSCEVINCSWDKDWWKQNAKEWPTNFKFTVRGDEYNQSTLLPLLSTGNANDNIVKLIQAYTVAKLNAANGANLDEVLENGSTLGAAIAEADTFFSNSANTSKTKLPAGIIGRLHQLPSCN